jgi:hypothetical protein
MSRINSCLDDPLGGVSLLITASGAGRRGREVSALRRGAGVPQTCLRPAYVGVSDRCSDMLHTGERLAGTDNHYRRRRHVRHDSTRSGAALVSHRMAALAHRAGGEHYDPECEDPGARLFADCCAAQLDKKQRATHSPLPYVAVHRTMVNGRRLC